MKTDLFISPQIIIRFCPVFIKCIAGAQREYREKRDIEKSVPEK